MFGPLGSSIVSANNGLSRRRKGSENVGEIVLRLQDIQYEGITFDKELNRIRLDSAEVGRYKLDRNDLLFVRVNGNPHYVGRSTVFTEYSEDVYHNDHLIRIKLDGTYNAKFLSYLLNYTGSRNIIKVQIKTSAGQHTISQSGIEKLLFYKPPIGLQREFIEIIERAKQVRFDLNTVEKLFHSLSQQAFKGELTKDEAA